MTQCGPVLGVLGGSGGVGASTFAAVLALLAGPSVLVDLDPGGGGIDVLLGAEAQPGARWSGLRLAGGRLDPDVLAAGLPRAGSCAVLAADTGPLDGGGVGQVVEAAAQLGAVVLDLPRAPGAGREAGLERCDLVVLLARADVGGLVAAHAVRAGFDAPVEVGVLVRRGPVGPEEAARLVGAPLLGALPAINRRRAPDPARPPRSVARVAAGLLAGLGTGPATASARLVPA